MSNYEFGQTVVLRDTPVRSRTYRSRLQPSCFHVLSVGEVLNVYSVVGGEIGFAHPALFGQHHIEQKFVEPHTYKKGDVVYVITDDVLNLVKGQAVMVKEDRGTAIEFDTPNMGYVSKRNVHPCNVLTGKSWVDPMKKETELTTVAPENSPVTEYVRLNRPVGLFKAGDVLLAKQEAYSQWIVCVGDKTYPILKSWADPVPTYTNHDWAIIRSDTPEDERYFRDSTDYWACSGGPFCLEIGSRIEIYKDDGDTVVFHLPGSDGYNFRRISKRWIDPVKDVTNIESNQVSGPTTITTVKPTQTKYLRLKCDTLYFKSGTVLPLRHENFDHVVCETEDGKNISFARTNVEYVPVYVRGDKVVIRADKPEYYTMKVGSQYEVSEDEGDTVVAHLETGGLDVRISKRWIDPVKKETETTEVKPATVTPTDTTPRRTWEYMNFTVSSDRWISRLNDLGGQGWELCSDILHTTGTSHTLTLKRLNDPDPKPRKNRLATLAAADIESLTPVELGALINRLHASLEYLMLLSPKVFQTVRTMMKLDVQALSDVMNCSKEFVIYVEKWGNHAAFSSQWGSLNKAYKEFLIKSLESTPPTKNTV